MFEGFEAHGFAASGEAPEGRIALGGTLVLLLDWVVRIYSATHELISRAGDDPPFTLYKGTLQDAFSIDRSIIGSNRIGEDVTIGLGEVTLANLDGDYDALAENVIALNQPIEISMGDRKAPLSTYRIILRGYTVNQDLGRDQVRFSLRDAGSKLDVPVSINVYAGTGDVEGGSDLEGKRKPKAFGYCDNIPAIMVIPASRVFQVNDGPVNAISAVYVKGVAMIFDADYATVTAMNAASISVGHYVTCNDFGFFRLGAVSDSETSQVTCDVQGDSQSGFIATAAAIVRHLLTTPAGLLDPDDLVTTDFDLLDALQPAPLGYFIPAGDEQTVRTVVGRIMASIGGWCGANRRGKCGVRRFDAPAGTPSGVYNKQVIEDVSRVELPDDLRPPPWRVKVGWGRNWTVQTSDIAGSVSDDRRTYLAESLRYATAEDNNIRLSFPPGNELAVDSYFRDQSDAQGEADRRLILFGELRELYVVKLSERLYIHEPGQIVSIAFDRLGLDAGRLGTIVRVRDSYAEGSSDGVELTIFT